MTKTSETETVPNSNQDHSTPDKVQETEQDSAEMAGGALEGDPADSKEEIGGPQGPEPTRYGDWEKKGRCIDF